MASWPVRKSQSQMVTDCGLCGWVWASTLIVTKELTVPQHNRATQKSHRASIELGAEWLVSQLSEGAKPARRASGPLDVGSDYYSAMNQQIDSVVV